MKISSKLAVTVSIIIVTASKLSGQVNLPKTAIKLDPSYTASFKVNSNIVFTAVPSNSNLYDRTDIQVLPSSTPQSEVHLSFNPTNPLNILLSCNTYPNAYSEQGYFYSFDWGKTWGGANWLANNAFGRGDPSTAFDASGNAYIESMAAPDLNSDANGYLIQKSTNGGVSWLSQVRGAGPLADGDKPMIAADNVSTSAYKNNLYCAWGSTHIQFNRSTNGGVSFSTPVVLPPNSSQGANVQTGPNGEVYLCFADYGNGPGPATDIEFLYSTDGGATLIGGVTFNFTGIRTNPDPDPLFNNIRVNDFPSMAIDKSTGPHSGRRYIVVAGKENGNGKAVIYLTYTDDNVHFSQLKEISIPNATQSWFPWIAVDDTNGDIYVDYYAFDTSTQWETNTYVAYSNDGGNTFSNQKVSDVSHTTAVIPGYLDGYTGDYIGIIAHGGKALAAWADDRSGTWQVYVSEVGRKPVVTGTNAFCSSATYTAANIPDGSTVTWSATPNGLVSLAPSGNQVTLTRLSQGNVTLTATIFGSYSDLSPSLSIVTYPYIVSISSSMSGPCTNGYQSWYLQATTNGIPATNWQWSPPNPTTSTFIFQSPNSPSTYVRVKGGGTVQVNYTDACGDISSNGGVTIYSPCTGESAVIVYPNPASNQLTIQNGNIITQSEAIAAGQTNFTPRSYSVQLLDVTGNVLKTGQSVNGNQDVILTTSDLLNGTYYLHIFQQGLDTIEKQVIIQH